MNKFIIILFYLASPALCAYELDEIYKKIYNLEISEIKKENDCLSILYINSTIGAELSKDALGACIGESGLVGGYYLHLANYNYSIYKLNYKLAAESLKLAQQTKVEIEKKINASTVGDEFINDKIHLISLQNAEKNNDAVYLKKKGNKFIYHDPISGQEFLFDTGSLFWSVKPDLCSKVVGKSIGVTGSNGSTSAFRICAMSTHHYSGYALMADKNIAGLMLALSKRSVVFGNDINQKSRRVNFYFDNDLIIISDTATFNSVKYDINICIDSGAKDSFITPKMYRKIRSSIKESKITPLVINSFTGNNLTYGRIIKFFSSNFFTLKNIYAVSNGDIMPPCDLVIGNDFLFENIIELNIYERELVLKYQ